MPRSSIYERAWRCPHCGVEVEGAGAGAQCPNDPAHALVPATVIERVELTGKDPLLGRVVAGYATVDRLGEGGFGGVYRAVRQSDGVEVALKLVDPSRAGARSDLRKRFLLEARNLAEIRAPGLVPVHDYGEADGLLYMAQSLVRGRTLYELLREQQRLPLERAVAIAVRVLEALEEPHDRGLIHRDIKPSNIMVVEEAGRDGVRVIDFGIAKDIFGVPDTTDGGPRTQTGVLIGTPKYMAPEQLTFETVGPRTDIYAVGIVLYEMIAGRPPFVGTPGELIAAHLKDPVPPLEAAGSAVEAVLLRALAKSPDDRFPNGRAMVAALRRAARPAGGDESSTVVVAIEPPPTLVVPMEAFEDDESTVVAQPHAPLAEPGPPRRRWLIPALVAVAAILGIGVGMLVGDAPRSGTVDAGAPALVASAPPVAPAPVRGVDAEPPDAAPPPPDAAPPPPDAAPPPPVDAAPRVERPRRKPRPKRVRPTKPRVDPAVARASKAAKAALRRCQCRVAAAHVATLRGLSGGASAASKLTRSVRRCAEPDVDERCVDGQTLPR